jgi:hypothetical protein
VVLPDGSAGRFWFVVLPSGSAGWFCAAAIAGAKTHSVKA